MALAAWVIGDGFAGDGPVVFAGDPVSFFITISFAMDGLWSAERVTSPTSRSKLPRNMSRKKEKHGLCNRYRFVRVKG